jgi:hypothetical protein
MVTLASDMAPPMAHYTLEILYWVIGKVLISNTLFFELTDNGGGRPY